MNSDWHTLLRRGLENQRVGRFEDAEDYFIAAYRVAPRQPEVCYALGRAKLRRDDFDEAELLLRAAWERDPSLISAGSNLARCLGLHGKRYDEAYAVLDQAERLHGDLAVLRVVRSELLLAQDRLREAEYLLEGALLLPLSVSERDAANTALARVANRHGVLCTERDENERAIFLFKRATHLDPTWATPHVNLGAASARLGMEDRAHDAYEQAITIDPQNPVVYEHRGILLRNQGEYEAAIADLTKTLQAVPSATSASVVLTDVYRKVGDLDNAIITVSQALQHDPDCVPMWAHLAMLSLEDGDGDNAITCLRQLLKLDPENDEARTRLTALLVRSGRMREATLLTESLPLHSPATETQSADAENIEDHSQDTHAATEVDTTDVAPTRHSDDGPPLTGKRPSQ